MAEIKTKTALKGGEFLIKETSCQDIFIPEEWTEEQRLIAQSCHDFLVQEVWPNMDKLDNKEEGLMEKIMDKAAELGMLGLNIPEQYGGFEKDFLTGMLATESIGAGNSFAVSVAAHTGIGTLPILYYGNDEQKAKYLPKLATGEWKACYCLTEPGAGSDANSGKTKATPSADGKHYVLNGQKMWITNSGFADVFIVFAKIENDKNLSAFIVEKDFGGITLNPEEHKMGIKGSSTRQVFFNDCKVPIGNLLSERENGFKIAVNILNVGRIKLAAAALGACKEVVTKSIEYANQRVQFAHPIGTYGAIQHKIAQQALMTFACESALYRASRNIEDAIDSLAEQGMEKGKAILKGIEQFAVEAAIMKVFGSEVLDFVVDEGVQVYGGMGYSADAPMDRAYRDSRINRIFEGTNEINRMLTVDMMLKRALKGELDLMGPAQKVAGELMSIPDMGSGDDSLFAKEKKYLANFKKAVLMVAGSAVQKLMMNLPNEQEIVMNIADMIIEVYVGESLQLRVEKLVSTKGETECALLIDMLRIWMDESSERMHKAGKEAICAFTSGDEQRIMLSGLKRFTKTDPFNAKDARRRIAAKLSAENKYCF
jgi:alkylation response protein AidB-like acyl-CoA dehydrogenase